MNNRSNSSIHKKMGIVGAGVLSAITASLCCITPVLALISGVSGVASTFSWLDPFRPYFIGITILVLGIAWYLKLKPQPKDEINCSCDVDERPSFWKSKKFLGIVTVFAVMMLSFPHYAQVFYPSTDKKEIVFVKSDDIKKIEMTISGMTCNTCAEYVKYELVKQSGIISATVSYKKGNAIIEFDNSKTSIAELEDTIHGMGYEVTGKQEK